MASSKKLGDYDVRRMLVAALAAMSVFGSGAGVKAAGALEGGASSGAVARSVDLLMAQRQSCKAASTCQEAVEMWCGGYSGADRDKDGIPCEGVCRSKSQVDAIKSQIGC
jgi:hypothetical protein